MLTDVPVRVGPNENSYVLGILPAGNVVIAYGWDPSKTARDTLPRLAIPGLGWITYDPASVGVNGLLSTSSSEISGLANLSPLYPAGTRTTDDPAINRIMESYEPGDVIALRQLVGSQPCKVTLVGVESGPICPAGVPEGSPIPGMYGGGCHGSFTPWAQAFLEPSKVWPEMALFAVTRENDGYQIVYGIPAGPRPFIISIGVHRDGTIAHLSSLCGASDPATAVYLAHDFILPPLKPPQLR
jgi:hypothetical protein